MVSIFVIQIFPMVFGGIVNVLSYAIFLLLFLYFSRYQLYFDVWFCLGVTIYGIESIFILEERYKITFMNLSVNYTAYKIYFWMAAILCALIFLENISIKNALTFRKYFLAIIGINAIANLIKVTFVNPNASRYMSYAGTDVYLKAIGTSNYVGTSDFDMIYSTAILCPCFLYLLYKEPRKKKLGYLIFNFTVFTYIITASFFIAILVMLLGISTFCFINIKKQLKYPFIMVVIFVCSCILLNMDIFYEVLLLFAGKIKDANISTRIFELVSVFRDRGEMVDAVVRLEIYIKIFQGFMKHPFLGCILTEQKLYTSYAGHSTILDILCGYGLLGSVPLFVGFHRMMKHQKRKLTSEGKQVLNCCYAGFLFMALFNPVTNGYLVLGTIMAVPTALLISEEKYEKNNCISSLW